MKYCLYLFILALAIYSCSNSEDKKLQMQDEKNSKKELKEISDLLQDSSFALDIAKNQEAAYYSSQGKDIPPFSAVGDSLVARSVKDEKIATNIAAFYALECGIGLLVNTKGGKPSEWLQKISSMTLDSSGILVLNRFANATWKAGQPFRGLARIKRDVFISSVFLPEDEIKKDYDQIFAAASKLNSALEKVKDSSAAIQFQQISQLLRDKKFSEEMARHMEAAYYTAQKKTVEPFLKPGEDTAVIRKNAMEEKIATNLAGFYALECGLSYLATAKGMLPSDVLKSIVSDNISKNEKKLFERFANATWKAGQPFRGLDRITRDNFTGFDLLSPEEQEKDWVQIKAAAEFVQNSTFNVQR